MYGGYPYSSNSGGGEGGRKKDFDNEEKDVQQSQVGSETEGGYSHVLGGGNNLLSADSGIMNMSNDRINGRYHDEREDGGGVGIVPYFKNHSLGGLFMPNSSDSESESTSGGFVS